MRSNRFAVRRHAARTLFVMLAAAMLAACVRERGGGASSASGGTAVIAASADADNLFPPLTITIQGRQIVDQVFDYLADIGQSLNTVGDAGFTPRLARSWRWSNDSLSIAFEIDPRARWHDGTPVRASDVSFTYKLVSNPGLASPVASSMPDVDSVTARDSSTAVVWFKRRTPEQFFEIAYNLAVLPEHLLRAIPVGELASSPFARHPVGSGRFRFAGWDAGSRITLVSDSVNYRGRAKLDRVVWLISPDMPAATTHFLAGETDFIDVVRGPTVAQVAAAPELSLIAFDGLDYGYLGFNLTGRKFADPELRRALSMGVDRTSLARNVFDSLAHIGLGPVTRAQTTADASATGVPYDSAGAAAILRKHPGLKFRILVPTSSAIRMRYATLLQEQYRKLGVEVGIDAVELNAFAQRLSARDYDAVLNAWHTDPSPSAVRQAWGSSAVKDGPNFTGYSSAEFDALIDSASTAFDPAASRQLYRKAYAVIQRDAPAVWLYEARNVSAVNRRLHVTGIRPDAWWAGLPDWTVAH